MTILEKIEKALEFLKSPENVSKTNELQSFAGVLGQCMGILGCHPSMITQYSTLLQQSIPILLSLSCHNSAEVRLVADEALNRVVVGATPFQSSRIHLHFHNSITSDKHPRWLRSALSRVYLGHGWLRAGTGRGRIFAQSTLIRLKDIVERISWKDPILMAEKGDTILMECLETNLPRIMKALSPFATKEEMFSLLSALLALVDSPTAPIRRNSANCIADICQYYPKKFISHTINVALTSLQDKLITQNAILGWFGTLRMIFSQNVISNLGSDTLSVTKYMQIYQMCLHYIDITKTDHNVLNAAMDCLNIILSDISPAMRLALLNPKGPVSIYAMKEKNHSISHRRSLSSVSMAHSIMSTASSTANLSDDMLISEQSDNIAYHGSVMGSISQIQTPHRSMEDLSCMKGINTPDSPCESMISELNSEIMTNEQFSNYVKEKLTEKDKDHDTDDNERADNDGEQSELNKEFNHKVTIGSFYDPDIPLKYCARLLISRFLLSGNSGQIISDRTVRVSLKASALSCLISIVDVYPEIMTCYLSVYNESSQHNNSGNSEFSNNSNNEQLSDFVLERNICYQESMTDSFGQDLLTKSIDLASQASGTSSNRPGLNQIPFLMNQKRDKKNLQDSTENSTLAGVPSSILDSKQQSIASNTNQNQMISSCLSGDSINLAMTASNFTMGSHTTASNYPASTDLLTTSIDPLTSSLDLEMIFDHFGDSNSFDPTNPTEIEQKIPPQFCLEQVFHELLSTKDNIHYDKQISNESDKSHEENQVNDAEANSKQEEKYDNDNCDIEKSAEQIETDLPNQHISEFLFLLKNHSDPQIRGLIRVCIGSFLNSVFDSSSGEYSKWKAWTMTSKLIVNKMKIDNLLDIIMTGFTDSIHSCVNHSILAIKKCIVSFCNAQNFIVSILNSIRSIENNPYWLCKVNLCQFYAQLKYDKLNILVPDWPTRSYRILDTLIKLLNDQDQRVRRAATEAITTFPPTINFPANYDSNSMIINLARNEVNSLLFVDLKNKTRLLADFKHSFVHSTLPNPLNDLISEHDNVFLSEHDLTYNNLKIIVHFLMHRLTISQCKHLTQGCLESLLDLSLAYPPTKYPNAYSGHRLFEMTIQLLEYRTFTVSCYETLLALTTQMYAAEAWNSLCQNNNSEKHNAFTSLPVEIKEKPRPWGQFGSTEFAKNAESFLTLTLKLFNILIHIIQEVTPIVIPNRVYGNMIPPSPIRKRDDKNMGGSNSPNIPNSDDKNKKKMLFNSTSGNFLPVGYFINDTVLMKIYMNLKLAYSSHKVNMHSTKSIFLNFVMAALKSLTIQLEIMSEREAEKIVEEIIFYLKCLLPLKPDYTITCLTALLKCLFSTNMTAHQKSFQAFLNGSSGVLKNKYEIHRDNQLSFYNDVLLANNCDSVSFDSVMNYSDKMYNHFSDTSENRTNYKLAEGFGKNSHLQYERDCYLSIKNFTKSKTDKEWTSHKQEYIRYIKLLEPVVIQALKSYTIQNNMSMQCKVLDLMNQLLSLRINYSFLDSDHVFIDVVIKQLELIERCEIFDCEHLVRCIFTFFVQLSSFEHRAKRASVLMDIPKVIQLCDGLMASDVYDECIQALHPLAYKVFVLQQQIPGQSRIQIQEAQVTKEVLFAMLQKMMKDVKIIKLVSSVLIFSEEHPESHFKWSQLACDTIFQLLQQKSINLNDPDTYVCVDKLFDCIHREVLYDQSKIEAILRIMFERPPDQEYTSLDLKEKWLATIVLFLRKIVINLAENEVLLSLNYLKMSHISPNAIFFNCQNEIDPLNVQTVNENCANLSPDVIFVRFLFRITTYALLEIENCDKYNLKEFYEHGDKQNTSMLYWCKLTTALICQVKHLLYLKDGCRFPLLAKTAQTVLQNEQSGLNTGLYSPEENIPLKRLGVICTKLSWRQPLLAAHWCHLLVRLKFIEQKYWASLLGFLHKTTSLQEDNYKNLNCDILQIGCFLALCEHFVDNGLDEVVNLSWLLVNRIHYLIRYYDESIVKEFVAKINENPSASGLLLQAIAAKCQSHIKGMYGIKVYRILSNCHLSQSGSLLFCICRFIGRLPLTISHYFVKLVIKQCKYLSTLSVDEANVQIPLDDLQMALEILHNDKVDKKYPNLIEELNSLAITIYNLSPFDIPLDRQINPKNIKSTSLDNEWLLNQLKTRCCKITYGPANYGRLASVAKILKSSTIDELNSIFASPEFDNEIIQQTFKLGTDIYIKEFIDKISEQECGKVERRKLILQRQLSDSEDYFVKESFIESNILNLNYIPRFRKIRRQSQFFISINDTDDKNVDSKELIDSLNEEKSDIELPEFSPLLSVSLKHFQKLVLSVISLFPKHIRPLSHEMGSLKDYHTMDKYTKRCFLVFRDNFFHQLILQVQTLLSSYLNCFHHIETSLEKADPDIIDKVCDMFLPKTLCNNLMFLSVLSLQYTTYLIKEYENSLVSENNGSFKNSYKNIDFVIDLCIKNASHCFNITSIWKELNINENRPRIFSAINCLYNYVKYKVKNTLPIRFTAAVSENESTDDAVEIALTCDKLLTMIQYWQDNCQPNSMDNHILSIAVKDNIEQLLISLCRCNFASTFTLVPPLAWNEIQLFVDSNKADEDASNKESRSRQSNKPERVLKSDIAIPINSLQDMDVLEQFLFRVNLIGWTCKKGFEEIWVCFLGALQGNGAHWAVRGMMQLLLMANYKHCSRGATLANSRIRRLKQVALDCNFYEMLFSDINLESIPYKNHIPYHYSQVSVDYLRHAAGLNELPDIKVQNSLNQSKKLLLLSGIDINSCVQLLIDISTQVLTQPDWGLGARNALLCCIVNISDIFTSKMQWQWLSHQLSSVSNSNESSDILTKQYVIHGQAKVHCVLGTEIPDVNQLTAALSSSFAPTRIAALHAAIKYLSTANDPSYANTESTVRIALEQFSSMLQFHLGNIIQPHLVPNAVVSFQEQSLCWTVLFSLIENGNNDLLKVATDFLFTNPNHFCYDLILHGICNVILENKGSLTNGIKASIFKILDTQPEECNKLLPLLLTQIYSSSDIQTTDNTLEPEQLMVHLQTFASLQKSATLSPLQNMKNICTTLIYCFKDFLPPAAMLNKVVQEFIDCCRWADSYHIDRSVALTKSNIGMHLASSYAELMGNVVFEVFEASIAQDQLTIFNGWLFDVLSHLIQGKISSKLTPYCLLCLMVCASSNKFIRLMAPIANYTLKAGCSTPYSERKSQIYEGLDDDVPFEMQHKQRLRSQTLKMNYNDTRLLCLTALHSNFSKMQIDKLKSLCIGEPLLCDLQSSLE